MLCRLINCKGIILINELKYITLLFISLVFLTNNKTIGENMIKAEILYPVKIEYQYFEKDKKNFVHVGYILITKEHDLIAHAIDSKYKKRFTEIVERLNKDLILYIDCPPPEGIKEEKFASYSKIVKKNDKGYIDAVKYNLEHPYCFVPIE